MNSFSPSPSPSLSEEEILLLEENTVNPSSHLPSFFELTFLKNTRISFQQSVQSILDTLQTHVLLLLPSSSSSTTTSWFKRIFTRILDKYKMEVRFLMTLVIEYLSFLHSSCTLEESLYDLTRCKVISMKNDIPSSHVTQQQHQQQNDTSSRILQYQPLSKYDQRKAAFILSFLPYLREKLHLWYKQQEQTKQRQEQAEQQEDSSRIIIPISPPQTSPRRKRFKFHLHHFIISMFKYISFKIKQQQQQQQQQNVTRTFYSIYPWLHMTYQSIHFIYQFRYLIHQSVYTCPISHVFLQQVVIRRQQQEQEHEIIVKGGDSNHTSNSKTTNIIVSFIHNWISTTNYSTKIKKYLLILFRYSIMYGYISYWIAFILYEIRQKRRQVFVTNSSELSTTTITDSTLSTLPIPPPPQSPSLLKKYKIKDNDTTTTRTKGDDVVVVSQLLPRKKDTCPLCHRKRLHPVAVVSSGYVYCFRCIVMYIRHNGPYCPMTGVQPCGESNLIRLYEPTITMHVSK